MASLSKLSKRPNAERRTDVSSPHGEVDQRYWCAVEFFNRYIAGSHWLLAGRITEHRCTSLAAQRANRLRKYRHAATIVAGVQFRNTRGEGVRRQCRCEFAHCLPIRFKPYAIGSVERKLNMSPTLVSDAPRWQRDVVAKNVLKREDGVFVAVRVACVAPEVEDETRHAHIACLDCCHIATNLQTSTYPNSAFCITVTGCQETALGNRFRAGHPRSANAATIAPDPEA